MKANDHPMEKYVHALDLDDGKTVYIVAEYVKGRLYRAFFNPRDPARRGDKFAAGTRSTTTTTTMTSTLEKLYQRGRFNFWTHAAALGRANYIFGENPQ